MKCVVRRGSIVPRIKKINAPAAKTVGALKLPNPGTQETCVPGFV